MFLPKVSFALVISAIMSGTGKELLKFFQLKKRFEKSIGSKLWWKRKKEARLHNHGRINAWKRNLTSVLCQQM
jgi:hypothetical protein